MIAGDEFDVATLSLDAKKRLNALKNLDIEHSKIHREFLAELAAVEKKYHTKYQPLFDKRADIVNGEYEPTEDETKVPETVEDYTQLTAEEGQAVKEGPVKGVPDFWLQALLNHTHIGSTISDQDREALKALKDIKVSYLADNPGFSLEFVFGENDFFTNTSLTKTYYLSEPDVTTDDDEYVFDRTEATIINWKEGKDLTVKVEMRKQRHKESNKTRVIKRTVPAETFFNFFKSKSLPNPDDETAEEVDFDELENQLEFDYQIGEEFKDRIVPQALQFFTGEASMEDDEDFDFDDEEGFSGEDEDSEEDDE